MPAHRHDHHYLQRQHSPHLPHPQYHHHNNHHHGYHRVSHSQPPSPQHRQSPEPAACSMERTATGGLSIRSEPSASACTELLEDGDAEQRVRDHMTNFRRRFPDSKHERILRSIINPRSNAEDPLDNNSLESIFSTANELFFNGRLSQRVMWKWSHESSPQYNSHVIGTTALRRASNRGFETLIVLSSPILRDPKYSRRLLISTFLHELIHSYLFICCGFRARHCGGHTPAFRAIAKMIDDWAGSESALYLGKMEADLDRFRIRAGADDDEDGYHQQYHAHRRPEFYPCSGVTEQQGYRYEYPQKATSQLGWPPGHDVYPVPAPASANSSWWNTNTRPVRPLDSNDDDPGLWLGPGSPIRLY